MEEIIDSVKEEEFLHPEKPASGISEKGGKEETIQKEPLRIRNCSNATNYTSLAGDNGLPKNFGKSKSFYNFPQNEYFPNSFEDSLVFDNFGNFDSEGMHNTFFYNQVSLFTISFIISDLFLSEHPKFGKAKRE
jgi:hypothetical protein